MIYKTNKWMDGFKYMRIVMAVSPPALMDSHDERGGEGFDV